MGRDLAVWEDVIPSIKVIKVERHTPTAVPQPKVEIQNDKKSEVVKEEVAVPRGRRSDFNLVLLNDEAASSSGNNEGDRLHVTIRLNGGAMTVNAKPQTRIYTILSKFLAFIGEATADVDDFPMAPT